MEKLRQAGSVNADREGIMREQSLIISLRYKNFLSGKPKHLSDAALILASVV